MNTNILLQSVNGKQLNTAKSQTIKNFSIDTRTLQKGDAFLCLVTEKADGHDYIKEAISKKASCILVQKEVECKTRIPIILVKDTYDALFQIASYYKKKYNPLTIAITGSSGKTTTKEMLSLILSTKYKVLKTEKNNNNHLGVPLTLTKLSPVYDIALIEMGMNHKGEISKLSNLVKPSVGIITSIGTSHIGYLKSKRNIFKAKMEITDGIEDGILLVNGDDPYLKKVRNTKQYEVIKCGYNSTYHLIPYYVKETLDGLSFSLYYEKRQYHFFVPVIGKHFLNDIMLSIEMGILLGIKMEDMMKVLEKYKPLDKRMNVIQKLDFTIIDDCYNANLEAFKGVLHVIKPLPKKKILIVGDMLELGKYSIKYHKKLGKEIKKVNAEENILVGKETKHIKLKNSHHFFSNEEAIAYLKTVPKKDTLILIKGSRGIHLEEIRNSLEE
ncbi:MAG: UDP-N-acetylmuramoyl-tripeptide--D-alanyl-D-alanine ligase [Bacilli bacterium]|nr:UDP-N-acetylmuramoyl-tripeptide--D-alanyl-D-alanine ligase [Bacilli bacterium]